MPNTTTLRLSDDLRDRIATEAQRRGTTAHAFMVDAITEALAAAELRATFEQDADEGLRELMESGEGLLWEDVRPWLQSRARGEDPPRPTRRPWR